MQIAILSSEEGVGMNYKFVRIVFVTTTVIFITILSLWKSGVISRVMESEFGFLIFFSVIAVMSLSLIFLFDQREEFKRYFSAYPEEVRSRKKVLGGRANDVRTLSYSYPSLVKPLISLLRFYELEEFI